MARVLIVDDHTLFRRGVRSAIDGAPDMEVVGEAESGVEALAKARELRPDLVLIDVSMPGGDGLQAVSAIKGELPDAAIVVLTVHDRDENLFEAIKRGARGFLSKDIRAHALLASMRGVLKGEAAISRSMAGKVLTEFARLARAVNGDSAGSQLTSRERDVLREVSAGLSNRQIADALCISENTVKVHVTSILKKLHVRNRAQAAEYARQWGLYERATGKT